MKTTQPQTASPITASHTVHGKKEHLDTDATVSTPPMNATRIEYHSKSDEDGKCSFSLFWMATYHPGHPLGENRLAERGQSFRADPRKHGFPRPEEVSK